MFTGLVRAKGKILSAERHAGGMRAVIGYPADFSGVSLGASIACSGCCLTVVAFDKAWFSVDISIETLGKTNLGDWRDGQGINLEPSLRLGDEIGGHLVSGHIDGVAVLREIRAEGDCFRLTIEPLPALMGLIAAKGSVALDGISLTVNEVGSKDFGVAIIPHTWAHTTLGESKAGDRLNIEADMLARYVARQLEYKGSGVC